MFYEIIYGAKEFPRFSKVLHIFKMKQRSMMEYVRSPLNSLKDYNVSSSEWLGKSGLNTTPVTTKGRKRPTRTKGRSRKDVNKVSEQAPTISPLEKWIQRKRNDDSWIRLRGLTEQNVKQHENKKVDRKKNSKQEPFRKSDSFEKYGIILPTADDILKNVEVMKEERKILDDYEDLVGECDTSIPNSLKSLLSPEENSPTIPILTCEHLSQPELKTYVSKYMGYLKNIFNGVEFNQRHQTYNKDRNSRSRLTYSFSTMVFNQHQLEYLMKKIEKVIDPEGKHTEYLFMVLLPEICLKIFMDDFDMSKEEAVDYLNRRPVD